MAFLSPLIPHRDQKPDRRNNHLTVVLVFVQVNPATLRTMGVSPLHENDAVGD
jgi:hypothetical protein